MYIHIVINIFFYAICMYLSYIYFVNKYCNIRIYEYIYPPRGLRLRPPWGLRLASPRENASPHDYVFLNLASNNNIHNSNVHNLCKRIKPWTTSPNFAKHSRSPSSVVRLLRPAFNSIKNSLRCPCYHWMTNQPTQHKVSKGIPTSPK